MIDVCLPLPVIYDCSIGSMVNPFLNTLMCKIFYRYDNWVVLACNSEIQLNIYCAGEDHKEDFSES